MANNYPEIRGGDIQAYLGGLQTSEVLSLATAAITALGIAGSEPEWDSETIEWVVGELQEKAIMLGFPEAGSTCSDHGALRYWAELMGNESTLEILAEVDELEMLDAEIEGV